MIGIGSLSTLWEREPAAHELPHSVYRIAPDGKLHQVIADLAGPSGLTFSPDGSVLYVVESRAAEQGNRSAS